MDPHAIYPSVHPATYPPIHLAINPLIHPLINSPSQPSNHLSIHPPTFPCIHPLMFIHPPTYPSIHPPTYPSIHINLAIHPFIHSLTHPSSHPTIHPSMQLGNFHAYGRCKHRCYEHCCPRLSQTTLFTSFGCICSSGTSRSHEFLRLTFQAFCDPTECRVCPWNSPGNNTPVGCRLLLHE